MLSRQVSQQQYEEKKKITEIRQLQGEVLLAHTKILAHCSNQKLFYFLPYDL